MEFYCATCRRNITSPAGVETLSEAVQYHAMGVRGAAGVDRMRLGSGSRRRLRHDHD